MNDLYQKNIFKIAEMINKSKRDIIIIGDNSIGKSDVLKKIIEENLETNYIIDSYNRTFNYKNTLETDFKTERENITRTRIKKEIFNLQDSFGPSGIIELLYSKYQEELKKMLLEFLGSKIVITTKKVGGLISEIELKVNKIKYDNLSSGYQAIIRIFLEVIYALEDSNINTIIIDEINEFLSTKNEAKILPYLKKKFPNIRFIVTTHSADVISSSKDTDIIVMKPENYELLDSNDYETNTDVRSIFEKIYFLENEENIEKENIDSSLRNILNKYLMGIKDEENITELKKLETQKLSSSQKMMLIQIKEMIK